jgi:hypothetical protein
MGVPERRAARASKRRTEYTILDEAAPGGMRRVDHRTWQAWYNNPDNAERAWIARRVFPLLGEEAIVVLTQFTGMDGPFYLPYATHIFAPARIEQQLTQMIEQFLPDPMTSPPQGIFEQHETPEEALERHDRICEFVAVALTKLHLS